MSSCPRRLRAGLLAGGVLTGGLLVACTLALAQAPAAGSFPGIGRAATAAELAAWDTEVRADFKGLPKGSGSVAKGLEVWEAKCASCHGVFGESNEVFAPIAGGTTRNDILSGRAARLDDPAYPGRTTLMKLSTVSTLWDYINRAMPWTAPRSLSVEEVYAVTAFILNLGGVVADDFTLSDANIAQVQQRLPNRHGMSTLHSLWPGRSFGQRSAPDASGSACMSACATEPRVASLLPDFARNAHGNLAEQNRLVGPQRGADTSRPAGAAALTTLAVSPDPAAAAAATAAAAARKLAQQHNCMSCHGLERKIVGPGFTEIARKYASRNDAVAYLAQKIRAGSAGVWGAVPMPAQSVPEADSRAMAQWLADGARR